jgi:hypothetical protein
MGGLGLVVRTPRQAAAWLASRRGRQCRIRGDVVARFLDQPGQPLIDEIGIVCVKGDQRAAWPGAPAVRVREEVELWHQRGQLHTGQGRRQGV